MYQYKDQHIFFAHKLYLVSNLCWIHILVDNQSMDPLDILANIDIGHLYIQR